MNVFKLFLLNISTWIKKIMKFKPCDKTNGQKDEK